MEPTCGDTDQATAVFGTPKTAAVNCWGAAEGVMPTLAGATETVITGRRVTIAATVLVESAMLVAVTVTVCWAAIGAGVV
jgi:hypothetical protein